MDTLLWVPDQNTLKSLGVKYKVLKSYWNKNHPAKILINEENLNYLRLNLDDCYQDSYVQINNVEPILTAYNEETEKFRIKRLQKFLDRLKCYKIKNFDCLIHRLHDHKGDLTVFYYGGFGFCPIEEKFIQDVWEQEPEYNVEFKLSNNLN